MDIEIALKNFLDANKRLTAYPAKRKMKLYCLLYIASKLDKDKIYTEREINTLINTYICFDDPATIRRELFSYHFLDRKLDGSAYWAEKNPPTLAELGLE